MTSQITYDRFVIKTIILKHFPEKTVTQVEKSEARQYLQPAQYVLVKL